MTGMSTIALGVNVDHVATVRQARRARHPDPVHAALLAEQSGADSITMHLREDRRHIIDRDIFALQPLMQNGKRIGAAVLKAENISLRFGGVRALSGISIEIREHEIFAIIGPNGAGKTSMLNVINGFYHPQEGTITWRGEAHSGVAYSGWQPVSW